MHLYIGGAYQGKLDCAKVRFGFRDEDIFTCTTEDEIRFRPCVRRLEEYVLRCLRLGADPVKALLEREAEWKDVVFIIRDISSGVVPIDTELRLWREAAGRVCGMLSARAETVTRVFCGLEERLK